MGLEGGGATTGGAAFAGLAAGAGVGAASTAGGSMVPPPYLSARNLSTSLETPASVSFTPSPFMAQASKVGALKRFTS